MCFYIHKNNNGPMVVEKLTNECDAQSHLICGKMSLAKILADCQYHSHLMEYPEEEIKKIYSDTAHSYRCYDEMLKKKNKK